MNLQESLNGISGFFKRLRFTDDGLDPLEEFVSFSNDQGHGMMLTGNDRREYAQCLENLVLAAEKKNLFSRKGLESLLQQALLRAWNREKGQEQLSEERIKQSVKWLRQELNASPKTYVVYMPAVGLDPGNLPTRVGKLTFHAGDSEAVDSIKKASQAIIASFKNEESQRTLLEESLMGDIDNNFRNKAVIELEVQAGDDEHAEEKVITASRQVIDVINFFADILVGQGLRACVSLVGEGNEVMSVTPPEHSLKMLILMRHKYGDEEQSFLHLGKQISEQRWSKRTKGPLVGLSLPKPSTCTSEDTAQRLFTYVSELLAKDTLAPLQERILSAFQWAGRATVDSRREESFLLYMISLESLVLGRKTHSEIVFQLKLRSAYLLKRTRESRTALLERLDSLYHTRSRIVHSGNFLVTDSELREARHYAKLALFTISLAEPFCRMTEESQLEEWFKEQLISGPGATSDGDGSEAKSP